MKVLVINAGSSSVKYRLYRMPELTVMANGVVEKIEEEKSELLHFYNGKTHSLQTKVEDHEKAIGLILNTLADKQVGVIKNISEIDSVGHRVVHGGEEFTGSVVIDEKVIASIEKFTDLAPLENPHNLTGIKAAKKKLPNAKQVACFDTAFHTTIPKVAYLYALDYELYKKYRIRRYGFHGTSHRYVARQLAQIMGKHKYDINAITCHLGNGCSITAVKNGKSVDTSMGFTPLEGLVMGTRSGDFDPAVLFYLADKGHDLKTLKELCNKKSGLLGISGLSNDMRNLLRDAESGNDRAKLAVDMFVYRIKKYIGAYTAVLGRVDALAFTGGIGENAWQIRAQICEGLDSLGIRLDSKENQNAKDKEPLISSTDSTVKVFVVPTNEEAAIAADTYQLTCNKRSQCHQNNHTEILQKSR
jgi:acetate kinase